MRLSTCLRRALQLRVVTSKSTGHTRTSSSGIAHDGWKQPKRESPHGADEGREALQN
jgi:hypothetical protein